jgi:predicted site-specific integrase-resolvase
MPNIKQSRFVSTVEAGKMLNVSRQQVNLYCRLGKYKTAENVGGTWIIERKEIEELANKPNKQKPSK